MNHDERLDIVGQEEVEFVQKLISTEYMSLLPWFLELRQASRERYAPALAGVSQQHLYALCF